MNFSPHSSTYNSASQQQSQQQGMNTYNNPTFYQVPTFTGYPYFANNYQYQPPNYPSQQSNYTTNSYNYNYPSKTAEVPFQGQKREHKPLLVFDPQRNEAVDLVEASKINKPNSLLDETKPENCNSKVSVSLNNIIGLGKDKFGSNDQKQQDSTCLDELYETDQDDHEISRDYDDDATEESYSESTERECQDETDTQNESNLIESEQQSNTEYLSSHPNSFQPIKYSQSIPNKMENLLSYDDNIKQIETSSSDNNLHDTLDSLITDKEMETRKMYNRSALLQILKSSTCKKPTMDCKEIWESNSIKKYNMVLRLQPPTSLIRSKHGYMPPHLRLKEECSLNTNLETLRRNFKCILNKIAPQNFDACFSDIKTLLTNTDFDNVPVNDCMECIIEEIFDKAVQEEAYSVTYANLCTKIVNYEDKQDTKWLFKVSLINRCKEMFETPLKDQLKSVREHWEKKIENEKDDKLKNLYISDIEEQVRKAKDKYFGNIRFIGELYLHDLLKANIINICVTTLKSKGNDEDALFSLCKLLETVGKKFDTKHNDKMKEYINSITEISEMEDLSSRIKFRLVDIVEMSQRNWTLRTIQAHKMIQPKTLDQVKKDDFDEKTLEASKLSNKTQIRLNKKINNSADIKLKPQQNKMQSLEISSIQMQSSSNIQLKPSYGLWKSGSGIKDTEWKNVESNKKNTRYSKHNSKYSLHNNKASPVMSRDESPSKVDIGGRFALLSVDDLDNVADSKDTDAMAPDQASDNEKQRQSDRASSSSTREQSPANIDYSNQKILDSRGIFKDLLDSGVLDVQSWCQLTDVSQTVANWIDWIMEKSKETRNMVGDELAKLIIDGKLSMIDVTEGLRIFSEEIDDLMTDIPLIWTFLAEFLERLIVDQNSDISFFKVIIDSTGSRKDIVNCIVTCLKHADSRLGHKIIQSTLKECGWSFKNIIEDEKIFLHTKGLTFLYPEFFERFRGDLIALLPNDDDDVNQFLLENFGLELTQTEQCVYFISCCVFTYLSSLPVTEIINYLCNRKLFFVRLLDRRSEFEIQALDALCDSFSLFQETGLMAVINGLSDNILSYDAFQQFIQRDQTNGDGTIALDTTNGGRLASDVYKVMLERSRR